MPSGWPARAPIDPFGVPPSFRGTAQRTLLLMVVADPAASLVDAVQRGAFYADCGFAVAVVYGACGCQAAAAAGGAGANAAVAHGFCPSTILDVGSLAVVPLPCDSAPSSTAVELRALQWVAGGAATGAGAWDTVVRVLPSMLLHPARMIAVARAVAASGAPAAGVAAPPDGVSCVQATPVFLSLEKAVLRMPAAAWDGCIKAQATASACLHMHAGVTCNAGAGDSLVAKLKDALANPVGDAPVPSRLRAAQYSKAADMAAAGSHSVASVSGIASASQYWTLLASMHEEMVVDATLQWAHSNAEGAHGGGAVVAAAPEVVSPASSVGGEVEAWVPEWLRPVHDGGHEVWMTPVRNGAILHEMFLPVRKGLAMHRVLAYARAQYAKDVGKRVQGKHGTWMYCRDCETATFMVASGRAGGTFSAYQQRAGSTDVFEAHTWHLPPGTAWHIAVPFACRYKRLHMFVRMLARVMRRLGSHRVQVGWSPCPSSSDDADQQAAVVQLGASVGIQVSLSLAPAPFARASALNAAVRAAAPGDLVVALDVDMDASPAFFLAAAALARRGVSAYFPVVWSEYNPAGVTAMLEAGHRPERGHWRFYGFGMVAMYRSDIDAVGGWDARFTTWGGEDNDMYTRTLKRLRVVRMHDRGLVHKWHDKDCSGVAAGKAMAVCIASKYRTEGTALSALLSNCPDMIDPPYGSTAAPAPAPASRPAPLTAASNALDRGLRAYDADAGVEAPADDAGRVPSGAAGTTAAVRDAYEEEAYDETDAYDAA